MPTNKRFFPVIHCKSSFGEKGVSGIKHALANIKTAKENGADGVFLVSHDSLHSSEIVNLYHISRKEYPDFYIGVNFLDIPASNTNAMQTALAQCPLVNALWMDSIPNIHIPNTTEIESFVGVAFKGQNPNVSIREIRDQCNQAIKTQSHITTSGRRTGKPPDLKKMDIIRISVGYKVRVAIASGINEENVGKFLLNSDDFFVSTSISKLCWKQEADYFVPEKVKALADLIHAV